MGKRKHGSARVSGAAVVRAAVSAPTIPAREPVAEFTGERAMPLAANMDHSIMREHWARYERVRPLVRGRAVLDVACGAGYGSDMLAQQARSVIGGDIEPGAVAYCAKHYSRANLSFAAMDIRHLPLADHSVDVVVSFETLEHIVEGEQFLTEITRVLRPDGTLAISVPLGGRVGNPYHVAYYQRGTLKAYLGVFFNDVEISYQRGETFSPESLSPECALSFTGEYAMAICRGPRARVAGLTSIIILTMNGLDLTRACLESIEQCTPEPHEVIVVDNGSSDGTIAYLRERSAQCDNLRVVCNQANLGFAGGNNQGLAIAEGEYAVLLNNDTVVSDGWLTRLLAHLRRRPDLGAVGPVSNRVSGPQLVSSASYGSAEEMRRFAAKWARGHAGELEEVPRLVGFCLMVRRAVIDRIGGLDERFGKGNFEDDDLCLRALASGFKLGIARDSFVHHVGGQTFKVAGIDFPTAMLENWGIFKAKWGLPAGLELGQTMRITLPTGDPSPYFVPLPSVDAVPEMWNPLAEAGAAMENGDYVAAAGAYARAAALHPGSLEARQGLALALMASGRLREAVLSLRQAILLAPTNAALRNVLGVALFQAGDAPGAEEVLTSVRELDAGDIQSLLNLVQLTRAQGRYAEATQYLKEALRLDASYPEALVALASISIELGNGDAALAALRRLERVAPEHLDLPLLRQLLLEQSPEREPLAAAS